jgi:hypothetical protein
MSIAALEHTMPGTTRRRAIVLSAVAASIAVAAVNPATFANPLEQGPCLARIDVLAQLERKYAETPIALGLSETGAVMEIYAARDGATWTAVMTLPNGLSCLLAAGESFQTLPMKVAGAEI